MCSCLLSDFKRVLFLFSYFELALLPAATASRICAHFPFFALPGVPMLILRSSSVSFPAGSNIYSSLLLPPKLPIHQGPLTYITCSMQDPSSNHVQQAGYVWRRGRSAKVEPSFCFNLALSWRSWTDSWRADLVAASFALAVKFSNRTVRWLVTVVLVNKAIGPPQKGLVGALFWHLKLLDNYQSEVDWSDGQ